MQHSSNDMAHSINPFSFMLPRFTKRSSSVASLSYKSRLYALNIDSLEARRLRAVLILVYKMLFGAADVVCKHFFSNRIIKTWNCSPAKHKHFASLCIFNHFLNSIDVNNYCL
jgi:hypothetical protein